MMPIVSYKLVKPLGENKEGTVMQLEQEVGEKLCEAGIATEAAAEDLTEENEEEVTEDTSMLVTNAVDKLTDRIEKTVANTVAKMPRLKETVPAEPKSGPIYKSNGAYIRGIIMAQCFGNQTERNKVMAHQAEIAKEYERRGIQTKAADGINETNNAQGGFLVNPQFSPDVYAIPHNQMNLVEMCGIQVPAQSLTFNQRYINESSLANGQIFGGLNTVATAEAAPFVSSLPAWNNLAFTLQKIGLFVYLTSEVVQDAAYPIESQLDEYAAKAFLYGLNTQVIQGTTYEGVLNAPSLVTYQTGEGAALSYQTLAGMFGQVYPDSQNSPQGVWLMHPTLVTALLTQTYTTGGTSPAWGLQYDAQDGLAGRGAMTPYRLFGKPLWAHYACSPPGVVGDVLYVDFATMVNYYRPFRVEVSKEFKFSQDEIAIRFVTRHDVKTRFRNRITGPTGGAHFSALVARGSGGIS